MAHSDWVPTREQDLVDLAEEWKAGLSDTAKITAFGWDQTECAEVVGKIKYHRHSRWLEEKVITSCPSLSITVNTLVVAPAPLASKTLHMTVA
jgi:hypothetical protein